MVTRGRGRGKGSGPTNRAKGPTQGPSQTRPMVSQMVNPRHSTSAKHLPSQYEITPPNNQRTTVSQGSPVPVFQATSEVGVRNFPPPFTLFPNATTNSGASLTSGRRTSPQPQLSPSPVNRPLVPSRHQDSAYLQPLGSSSRQARSHTSLQPGESLLQSRNSLLHQRATSASNHQQSTPNSSEAQNNPVDEYNDEDEEENEEEEDEADGDAGTDAPVESTLPPDVLASLHELITQPGREDYTTLLSPHLENGRTW